MAVKQKQAEERFNLWGFYYNPMVYESSSEIISYHRTKKGATQAMKAHKQAEKEEFDRLYKNDTDGYIKFGAFERWYVSRFELIIRP